MKIIKRIIIGAGILAGLSLTSCDLTTESQSTFDDKSVFSDPTLTEYQLFSIYEVFGHTNSHRGRYLPWYGYNTDIEWYLSSDDKGAKAQYAITVNDSELNQQDGPYNELFAGIERANLAIDGIRTYGAPDTRPEMAALLGEALTMRAVLYTELLKAFGEVPARFEPVSPETIYLNKSDKDVIYKQLLADLEESFDYMAWPGQSSATMRTDRASLALAKGLYARLALMASGFSLRPEKGQVGTGNPGKVLQSDDPELQKDVLYPKALAALKDVIDHSGLDLMDYEELWRGVNNMDLTAGNEIIWVIPFSNTRGRWNYTFAVRNNGRTQFSPTDSNRGGQAGPVPTLYWKYGENDVRRDISCVNFAWEDPDGDGVAEPYPAGIANWYFGKYRFEWMETNPYTGGNDDGVKPVWMRYSDILLMAAEIAADEDVFGGTDFNYAKQQLLKVRKRAYKGHEDEAETYVNSLAQADFFDAIVDERALEFVGEFLRKGDLIRWNLLDKKLADEEDALDALATKYPDGRYLWYRYGTDANGITTIEMYGLGETENEANADVPPAGTGWQVYTNSEGEPSKYFTGDGEMFKNKKVLLVADDANKSGENLVPWWPIFETSITSSQDALVNDYGF